MLLLLLVYYYEYFLHRLNKFSLYFKNALLPFFCCMNVCVRVRFPFGVLSFMDAVTHIGTQGALKD